MMLAIKKKYPKCDFEVAGNYAGGLLNSVGNLGQIIGPLYGATTYAALNFRMTQDIMALLCITVSVLYFCLAEGKLAFS